jgi:hypothetical protein
MGKYGKLWEHDDNPLELNFLRHTHMAKMWIAGSARLSKPKPQRCFYRSSSRLYWWIERHESLGKAHVQTFLLWKRQRHIWGANSVWCHWTSASQPPDADGNL